MVKWLKHIASLPKDKDEQQDRKRVCALYFAYDYAHPTEQEFKKLSTLPLPQLEEKCWNSVFNYKLGNDLMQEMSKQVPDKVLYERPGFCSLYMLEQVAKGMRPAVILDGFSKFNSISAVDEYLNSHYPDTLLPDAISITPFFRDIATATKHYTPLLDKLTKDSKPNLDYEPTR